MDAYTLYYNSHAKKEKFLWFTIQTSGHGYWMVIAHFSTTESAWRYASQHGMDPSKCKVVRNY
jgi:hypothetical protein